MVAFISCNHLETDMEHRSGISIKLISSSHNTKATIPGVDDLNENLIKTIHVFAYPENPNNNNVDNTEINPCYAKVINVEKKGSTEFFIDITEQQMNDIYFPRPNNECEIYVIANLPSGIINLSKDANGNDPDLRLSTLKSKVLEANFNTKPTQDYFIMDGLGKAKLKNRTSVLAAEGTIELDRIASKLTVNINVDASVEFDGQRWESVPQQMKMHFFNGNNTALLSGDPQGITPALFNIENRTFTKQQNDTYWKATPIYSYPLKWDIGAENEPYLKIELPWVHETTENGVQTFVTQSTFYKVILGGESLAKNTWYDMNIHLSILGNFNDFESTDDVDITDRTYRVLDWNNDISINTEILGARYLVVDKLSYELDNQEVLRIPISTSHECEIVDVESNNLNQASITRPNYSAATVSTDEIVWDSKKWNLEIVKTNTESYIQFTHTLNNDLTSSDIDFAPYNISFRVRHADDDYKDIFYKDITIVQNPAMMILCYKNRDLDGGTAGSNKWGGVYVNGKRNKDTYSYGGVIGLQSSTSGYNVNPNMYVIQTSVLSGDSEYVIGDPRTDNVDNLNNGNWQSAKGIENLSDGASTRTPKYYYPTNENAKNIIAPKFRIASSYGVMSSGVSYDNAKNRCASYQEDGYPAGRWRIPTLAEIRFIMLLSSYDIIPDLFSSSQSYWYAGGSIKPGQNSNVTITEGTGSGSYMVRCVYDEWYWGNLN